MRPKCVWNSVAFLVTVCGAFASQQCGVDRANECKHILLDILSGDFTKEEACGEFYGVSNCFRNVVDDCSGEEEHPEIEQSLKEFEDLLDNNCGAFSSQECGVDRANECKQILLDILFGDFTEEEACGEFYGVSNCLRNVVDDCLGEEEHREVEQTLKEFEDFLDNKCGAISEGDTGDENVVDKCLEKNQEYLMQCIFDEETGDINKLLDVNSIPADIDPEFVKCYLYGLMAHCVVGRSWDRCGEAGGERAAYQLSSGVPSSVMDSCYSQPDSAEEIFAFNLLRQRKKRAPQDWLPMIFGKR
ncbi:hypothetical protein JTE90_010349 [Oedothorax gibbosus]|uniref:Secreted protein n=1 Tax=Oedothorax gibbosus TaxID=931172 RepID=A0AAV6U0Y1_9ARAC|nr:hypothetical protein JTE90_010349 [Oedothorax gibbosus]